MESIKVTISGFEIFASGSFYTELDYQKDRESLKNRQIINSGMGSYGVLTHHHPPIKEEYFQSERQRLQEKREKGAEEIMEAVHAEFDGRDLADISDSDLRDKFNDINEGLVERTFDRASLSYVLYDELELRANEQN